MKITITRALSKLKTLKSEYERALYQSTAYIAVKQGEKLIGRNSSYLEKDFTDKAKSNYQSLTDMMALIVDIKTKIDNSNHITVVKIGDKEMSVQQAIVEKSFLPLRKELLNQMKSHLEVARTEFKDAQEANRKRIEKIVQDQCSAGQSKTNDLEKDIYNSIENLYKVNFVDPLNLEELIEKLEKEIVEFESTVDYVLSESNSTTYIDI